MLTDLLPEVARIFLFLARCKDRKGQQKSNKRAQTFGRGIGLATLPLLEAARLMPMPWASSACVSFARLRNVNKSSPHHIISGGVGLLRCHRVPLLSVDSGHGSQIEPICCTSDNPRTRRNLAGLRSSGQTQAYLAYSTTRNPVGTKPVLGAGVQNEVDD